MAASTAHAVRDFVFTALKNFVTVIDFQAHKAKNTNHLEKFEINQKHQLDQIQNTMKVNHQELKGDIARVQQKIEADVAHAQQKLENEITQVRNEIKDTRHELKGDIDKACNKLNNKINELKFEIVKWIIGLSVAQAGLSVAVLTGLKIFGH